MSTPRTKRSHHIVTSLQGTGPGRLLDACPLCDELRHSGATELASGPERHEWVPVRDDAAAHTIDVTVEGDARVARVIGRAPLTILLDRGTTVGQLVAHLVFLYPALADVAPRGLWTYCDESAEDGTLRAGSSVRVCASVPSRPHMEPERHPLAF